jgi:hypothetical protein
MKGNRWTIVVIGLALATQACDTNVTREPAKPPPAPMPDPSQSPGSALVDPEVVSAQRMIVEGRRVFRFETFGD